MGSRDVGAGHVAASGNRVYSDVVSVDGIKGQGSPGKRELVHEHIGVLRVHLTADDCRAADRSVDDVGSLSSQQAVAVSLVNATRLDKLGGQRITGIYEGHVIFEG